MRRPQLLGILLVALLSLITVAEAQEKAPRFTATSLSGATFTSDSVAGKPVLIQFWATWCPHCRDDQPVVDGIARDFVKDGLVVLAVNSAEPEATVKAYLAKHPRACEVVLANNTNLVKEYAPPGLPSYVMINRDGDIVAMQDGAGGLPALQNLLSRAGLGASAASSTRNVSPSPTGPKAADGASAKVIEITGGQSAATSKPVPPTVFILRNGEKLEVNHYTISGGSLHVDVQGKQRTIPLTDLDLKATTVANHERGIDLKIPTNPGEIFLGF